ncbi:MAG: hypothetical protein MJZ28_05610 [Paludibacteraceae bacterium]|nr:hypothetical protein [Paludibacteraceae bacterium]
MDKLIYTLLIVIGCCNCAEEKKKVKENPNEITMTTTKVESERNSLTDAQQSLIQKHIQLRYDTTVNNEVPYYSKDVFTAKEFDAEIELSSQYYNLRNLQISDEKFDRRLKEVFGYDKVRDFPKDMLWRDFSINTVIVAQPEDFENFWISKSSKTIMHDNLVDIRFDDNDNYIPKASLSDSTGANFTCCHDEWKISKIDLYYHWNNYIFNESKASRVWLLKNDIYFMTHLITNFGYDGDMELNKALLGDIIDGFNYSLHDQPFSVVHFYPEGRIKIMDGLLKTMEELSTAENSEYFYWAENELYKYAPPAIYDYYPTFKDNNDEDNEEHVPSHGEELTFSRELTFKESCEVIAHITNYIYPVYLKFIDGNIDYGDVRMHAIGVDIPNSFWNVIFRSHEVFYEIERNNGYGLPNMQQLLASIKNDPRFYNDKGVLAPWDFEYPNADE